MILLPTRGRPQSLARFINAYNATKATLPVCVIIDQDDYDNYMIHGVVLPSDWPQPVINKKCHDLNAAFNLGFETFPDAHYYGIMADDVTPETQGWDIKLRDACIPHYIAWGEDGIRQANALDAPALCTHPFIGGDLARAWGWIMSPYTNRHCQDIIWRDFSDEMKLGKFLPDVVTLHRHWQSGRGQYDATYAIQPSPKEGDTQYRNYKASAQFYEDVARVRETLKL